MDLEEAVADALSPEPPRSVPALVEAAGGRPFQLARRMAGLTDTEVLPAKGTSERKAYDANRRWAERQVAGTRTHPDPEKLGQARRAVADRFVSAFRRELRRRGARNRLVADIEAHGYDPTEESGFRRKVMPVGGLGVKIPAERMGVILGLAEDGDMALAADIWLAAFCEGYQFPIDEVLDVESLVIWPDGDPEP